MKIDAPKCRFILVLWHDPNFFLKTFSSILKQKGGSFLAPRLPVDLVSKETVC